MDSRDEALRLAASLSRAAHLAASHDAALASGYGDVPRLLADALGVGEGAGEGFVDAVLDEGVASRVARLAAPMLAAARAFVKDAESFSNEIARDARDEISTGSAVGIMAEVERLEPFAARGVAPPGTPLVVFARRVSGAEDVAAAGRDVRGVVTAEPVRSDTRLAIRAAQDGVPATASASARHAARALVGEWVSLRTGPAAGGAEGGSFGALGPASAAEIELALVEHAARVSEVEEARRSIARADDDDSRASRTEASAMLAGPFRRAAARDCAAPRRDLKEATPERAGYKAASLGDVAPGRRAAASGFHALRGVTLPFGCFEACVRERGSKRSSSAPSTKSTEPSARGRRRAARRVRGGARGARDAALPRPRRGRLRVVRGRGHRRRRHAR